LETSVKIYPNPVKDFLYIENILNAELHIFDISGRKIKTITKTNNIETIDTKNFKAGLYFLKIIKNGNILTKQISIIE